MRMAKECMGRRSKRRNIKILHIIANNNNVLLLVKLVLASEIIICYV